MKTIITDGKNCKNKEQTHEYLAKISLFPQYYGKNLDALYDVLTSCAENVYFSIINSDFIESNLGKYGQSLLGVFKDAARENKNIKIEIDWKLQNMSVVAIKSARNLVRRCL